MRVGLIAAVTRTDTGSLRAELPLAGQSVLAWQVDLLQMLGVERVLCLTEGAAGEVLRLQHGVEASGAKFHALHGFAAIPALVRAEDDLIVLRDGLVPDPILVRELFGDGEVLQRVIASMPASHPMAQAHPIDFERIDAARHWAGALAMRGAPVQQLADFPADSDAFSVLLRLALQAGTPCRDLTATQLTPQRWLLADGPAVAAKQELALIADAAKPADWRAPGAGLAGLTVRQIAPRGLRQGGLIAGAIALTLMAAATLMAALGLPVPALAAAAFSAFAGQVSDQFSAMALRLRLSRPTTRARWGLAEAIDVLAMLALWFVLAPWPQWQPLAVLGPLTVGLARLAALRPTAAFAVPASDRTALFVVLACAAGFGVLPEVLACLALGLLAGLLLHPARE
jgi:hypothetical protein